VRIKPTSIELHLLDAMYVPSFAPVSTGDEILWAGGTPSPSEIWRYVPGSPEPQRIYASSRRGSTITAVAGSRGGYAFVESSKPEFGDGGWRIWYLPDAAAQPIELDRGNAKHAGTWPTVAVDERRVAWDAFDEPVGSTVEEAFEKARSRLSIAATGDPAATITLLDLSVRERVIWFPELNGDELWYSIIEPPNALSGRADHYHIETIDLAQPGAVATPFAGFGNDFDPSVDDAYVVWKSNPIGDGAMNWGPLELLDRAAGTVTTIPFERAGRPSLGDRFVTFGELFSAKLPLYDLETGTVIDLAGQMPEAIADATFYGENVRGRLLTFGVGARIGWAILPE